MNLRLGFAICAAAAMAVALAHAADDDPYRVLENAADPATSAFFRDEADRGRDILDRIPGRAKLLARIHELSHAATRVVDVQIAAGRVFYLKTAPGQELPALCVRDGFGGAERVLVDPQARAGTEAPAVIDWYAPSPDAQHVAYGTSRAGSEASLLRVLEVASARDLPFEIDRARFNRHLEWHPDGRSFYYARIPEGNPDGAMRDANPRLYRHVLGRETARDEVVFGSGVGGALEVTPTAVPSIYIPPESKHAYAIVREGVRSRIAVHVADLKDLAKGAPRWHRLAGPDDGVLAVEGFRDDLYLLSNAGAPRHRVLRMKASASLATARVAVPQGDSVITAMALARDALYLRTMVGGVDRLERSALGLLGMHAPEYLRTPFDTAIAQLMANPRHPGAVLRLDGWIDGPAVVEVDAKSGDLRDTRLQPPPAADFSAIDQVRLYAPTADGARIPITLVYRKSTQLTGSNPTLLLGLGAYGAIIRPHFDPALLAWLERGGVFAIAHVRGGGEFGEAWREAGRGAAMATRIGDFVAASQFLASYGFTGPKRLAVEGTGAGGIAVGGAVVRRPELFAAAILRAPWLDLLDYEQAIGGPAQVPEFGSAASAEARAALAGVSPYAQVRAGTAYPGLLLSVALNDPSVAPWQAAKMAARVLASTTSGRAVLLRVDPAAGLGDAAPRARRDEELADIYAFALWQMGDPAFQPSPAPPPPAPPPLGPKRE